MDQGSIFYWAIAVAILGLLAMGILIGQYVEAWWLRHKMKQRAEIVENSPNVMRQRIKDLEKTVSLLSHDKETLLQENEGQRVEIRRLIDRNKLLANEVRYDPTAKTECLGRMSVARTRWKLVTEEDEV